MFFVVPVIKKSKYVLNNKIVDNRPARLVISGFELDDSDAVLSHFKVSLFLDNISGQKQTLFVCQILKYIDVIGYNPYSHIPKYF